MNLNFTKIVLLLFSLLFLSTQASSKEVVGWIEPVNIEPYGIRMRAKLDSGAEHSSLNAPDVAVIKRNGVKYARFSMKGRRGKVQAAELPIFRYASIRRHSGRSQERPVILLEICLGQKLKEVEVNLIDRSEFKYQLLLGRSFLAPDFLVDSARESLSAPDCKEAK